MNNLSSRCKKSIVDFSTYLKIKIKGRIGLIKSSVLPYFFEFYFWLIFYFKFAAAFIILAKAKFPVTNCPTVLFPKAVFQASDINFVGTL